MTDLLTFLCNVKQGKFAVPTADQIDRLITAVQQSGPPVPMEGDYRATTSPNNLPVSLKSFSAADRSDLERFNIVSKGRLYLRPKATLREAIIASRIVGPDKLWSNELMYKHLAYLLNSFIVHNESSSKLVIDTFFFRSMAMFPSPDQKMTVTQNTEVPEIYPRQSQSDITGMSGMIDYAAIVAKSTVAVSYVNFSPSTLCPYRGGEIIAFIACEMKVAVKSHFSKVLLELMACARSFGKSHIRGALTNGFEWRFIQMDLDGDGDGAKYWISEAIKWRDDSRSETSHEFIVEGTSDRYDPALIAGILSTWIPQSFEEFDVDSDQWFYWPEPRPDPHLTMSYFKERMQALAEDY